MTDDITKHDDGEPARGPKAVLLDVDGTLIDSNDAHARSWVDTFTEFGYDIPFERVRPLIGMGGDKLLPTVAQVEKESEEGKRLGKRRGEIFRERYLPTLRPFPRARELLERLRDDGRTLVVATSAQKEELRGLLQQAGVADLMDEKTSASDAPRSKPDPDIVEAAVERSGVSAAECVMIGDTPYDIRAAGRAGVPTIALRCGGWWHDDDLAGAVEIFDDPAALLDAYPRSVLSTGRPQPKEESTR